MQVSLNLHFPVAQQIVPPFKMDISLKTHQGGVLRLEHRLVSKDRLIRGSKDADG